MCKGPSDEDGRVRSNGRRLRRAHHDNFGVDRALAQLGHADGRGQEGVDTRVGRKLGREGMAARGAGLLALRNPLVEAAQAEVMLAGRLRAQPMQ